MISASDPTLSSALAQTIRPSAKATDIANAKVDEVAQQLEGVFLYQLLEPLEKTSSAFFGEGPGTQYFSQLFRQTLSDQMATTQPLGIANLVRDALAGHAPADAAKTSEPLLPNSPSKSGVDSTPSAPRATDPAAAIRSYTTALTAAERTPR